MPIGKAFGIPVMFALAGFILAYIIICSSSSGHSPFSELTLSRKKEVIENYLEKRKHELTALIASLRDPNYVHRNTEAYNDSLIRTVRSLNNTIKELVDLRTRNPDTSLNYYLHYFGIERNSFANALIDSSPVNGIFRVPILVSFLDSTDVLSENPRLIEDSIFLEKSPYKYKVTFFREHGPFALWVIYSLAEMMILFLLLPLIWMRFRMNSREIKNFNINITRAELIKSIIIPAMAIIAFMVIFYRYLADLYLVHDHYFLSSFNTRIRLYLMPVYIFSGIYFALFLLVTGKMAELNNLKKQNASLDIKMPLKNLQTTFDLSFLCTAINLSLSVIWMGILYSAINTMEGPRYFTLLTGKPFLSHDLVYLTGLLHSALLLIFYLPVKWRLDIGKIMPLQSEEKKFKVAHELWDTIIHVLVTASPLLSALLQKLVTNLLA